jgi:hypothetical protein
MLLTRDSSNCKKKKKKKKKPTGLEPKGGKKFSKQASKTHI